MCSQRKVRADARSYLQTFLALVGRRFREICRKLLKRTWQALAAVSEHDCGADETSWIPAFSVGVRNHPAEAGFCHPGLSVANFFANCRKRLTEQNFPSPLAWAFGSGIIRPETNAPHWVQRAGFGQPFIASAQKVMVHGGVVRGFGVIAK